MLRRRLALSVSLAAAFAGTILLWRRQGGPCLDKGVEDALERRRLQEEKWNVVCSNAMDRIQSYMVLHGEMNDEGVEQGIAHEREVLEIIKLIRFFSFKNICITGFGAGYLSLAALCASHDTKVFAFDPALYKYTKSAQKYIDYFWGKRHRLVIGDTRKTLLTAIRSGGVAYNTSCDVAIIGGGRRTYFLNITDQESFFADYYDRCDTARTELQYMMNLTRKHGHIIVEKCSRDGMGPYSVAYRMETDDTKAIFNKQLVEMDCELGVGVAGLCFQMCLGVTMI